MLKNIIKIGNSKGIILPKEVIDILKSDKVKIEIKTNNIILRKPKKNERI